MVCKVCQGKAFEMNKPKILGINYYYEEFWLTQS